MACQDLAKSDFLDANLENGDLVWASQISGPGSESVYGVDVLTDGDIAVTGRLGAGEILFADGTLTETVGVAGAVFTARYAPSGEPAWVGCGQGGYDSKAEDVVVASDNAVVTTGTYFRWLVFEEGEADEVVLGNQNNTLLGEMAFIAKYGKSGDLLWARSPGIGSAGAHRALALDVSFGTSTETYVFTGVFQREATFGLGEANETTLTAAEGLYSLFVASYDEDGGFVWAVQAEGESDGRDVIVTDDGAVVVVGGFEETTTFGPEETDETSLVAVGGRDAFVAKYASDGKLAWVKSAEGSFVQEAEAVAECQSGSVLVAGEFEGSVTLGKGESGETILVSTGGRDVFFAKYSTTDGALLWARSFGGAGIDEVSDIAVSDAGGFLLTGSFQETVLFGTIGEIDLFLESAGGFDVFVAEYDGDGNLLWGRQEGGAGRDIAYAVATPSLDSTILGGFFESEVTFGAGEPAETTLIADGRDAFVTRIEF